MTVSQGRKRLEETLASSALTDKDSVHRMVYNQLVKSSAAESLNGEGRGSNNNSIDELAQNRFAQVWDLLDLLRSASGEETQNLTISKEQETSSKGWKLKADTGQMRVMYREGPEGTPFHTLLAEGLIYSPIVNSLCLAWEAPSYSHWWPHLTVPSFKVIESRWVKRVHIGEDLSLIRVKVPWPLATREVLMYAFELEYFEEELIIVLLHSAPTSEIIDEKVHGFKASDLPDAAPNVVRMELAGGFVLQRLTADQSYFRTVANLDIKMDFVPPWLINFVARQLVGHGFKLYQNTLIAMNNDEGKIQNFKKIIETEPMYARIEVGLQSRKANEKEATRKSQSRETIQKSTSFSTDPGLAKASRLEDEGDHEITEMKSGGKLLSSTMTDILPVEVPGECSPAETSLLAARNISEEREAAGQDSVQEIGKEVDSEVQTALQLLDRVISFVHAYTAGSIKNSPLMAQIENSIGSSQNPSLNSLDPHCNSSNPIHDIRLTDCIQEQECSGEVIPQRLEKVLPQLKSLDHPQELAVSNRNFDVSEAREPKPKRRWSCFSFLPLCSQ